MLNANINGIQRYDIVVAKIIENNETSEVIKRVIGMPNDTISCKDEVIYINGEPLDEPYLNTSYKDDWVSKNYYFTKNFSEVKLGEDEYFLMGDNRPLSLRFTVILVLSKENRSSQRIFLYYGHLVKSAI